MTETLGLSIDLALSQLCHGLQLGPDKHVSAMGPFKWTLLTPSHIVPQTTGKVLINGKVPSSGKLHLSLASFSWGGFDSSLFTLLITVVVYVFSLNILLERDVTWST